MGIGRLIGRFWPLRAERPEAERAALREHSARADRPAGEALPAGRELAARQPVDEQAGDSFLGYLD